MLALNPLSDTIHALPVRERDDVREAAFDVIRLHSLIMSFIVRAILSFLKV